MSLIWRQCVVPASSVNYSTSVIFFSNATGITRQGTHFRPSSSSGNQITFTSARKVNFLMIRPKPIKILQDPRLHRVHDYAALTEPTGMYDCPFGQPQNQSRPAASYRIIQPGTDGENTYSGDQSVQFRRGSCRSRRCMQLMRHRSPGRAAG